MWSIYQVILIYIQKHSTKCVQYLLTDNDILLNAIQVDFIVNIRDKYNSDTTFFKHEYIMHSPVVLINLIPEFIPFVVGFALLNFQFIVQYFIDVDLYCPFSFCHCIVLHTCFSGVVFLPLYYITHLFQWGLCFSIFSCLYCVFQSIVSPFVFCYCIVCSSIYDV